MTTRHLLMGFNDNAFRALMVRTTQPMTAPVCRVDNAQAEAHFLRGIQVGSGKGLYSHFIADANFGNKNSYLDIQPALRIYEALQPRIQECTAALLILARNATMEDALRSGKIPVMLASDFSAEHIRRFIESYTPK